MASKGFNHLLLCERLFKTSAFSNQLGGNPLVLITCFSNLLLVKKEKKNWIQQAVSIKVRRVELIVYKLCKSNCFCANKELKKSN